MSDLQVLVAHDSESLASEICDALRPDIALIATAKDGEEALSMLLRRHPRVFVVDVGLPGRASFELCDDIRTAGLQTRVLLVASVYNHTRYKRRPTSLYGADDYVEQHHIHDMLATKVAHLLKGAGAAPIPKDFEPQPETSGLFRVQRAGQGRLTIAYDNPEEGARRAARLAELIAADVALYHGDALGSLAQLADAPQQLSDDLQEARALFARRVPEDIRGDRDWIGGAFGALLPGRGERAAAGGSEDSGP